MSKIIMVKDTKGCSDGVSVELFKEGVSYDIPSEISLSLAIVFVDMDVAQTVTSTPTTLVSPLDTKDEDGTDTHDSSEDQREGSSDESGPTHDKMITPTRQ